jgi:hypothetical protein
VDEKRTSMASFQLSAVSELNLVATEIRDGKRDAGAQETSCGAEYAAGGESARLGAPVG